MKNCAEAIGDTFGNKNQKRVIKLAHIGHFFLFLVTAIAAITFCQPCTSFGQTSPDGVVTYDFFAAPAFGSGSAEPQGKDGIDLGKNSPEITGSSAIVSIAFASGANDPQSGIDLKNVTGTGAMGAPDILPEPNAMALTVCGVAFWGILQWRKMQQQKQEQERALRLIPIPISKRQSNSRPQNY